MVWFFKGKVGPYHKYVSNNALVYVSLLILTHIAYYCFVLYDYYSCSVQNVPFIQHVLFTVGFLMSKKRLVCEWDLKSGGPTSKLELFAT